MNRILKSAVIGCGMISKNHFKAINQIENARCCAVCDTVPERAGQAAAEYGASKVYSDYRELLKDGEIDVVHICTPHFLHGEMAVAALEAGKHVLCEKPMALSAIEAGRMIEARDRAGRQLGICFQNRYNESSVYMKRVMESGALGAILGARGQVTWDRCPSYYTDSPWRGKWATEGGGVLINQAIHTFDLLHWLTGGGKRLEATISTKRLKDVIEVEDTVDILLEGEQGERFLFYASNCYVKNAPVELEIICRNGSLKLVGNTVTADLSGDITVKDYSSGMVYGKDYWGSGHGSLIEDFYRCIDTGEKFPVSGEEGIAMVKLLEAVYRSGREHRLVLLN